MSFAEAQHLFGDNYERVFLELELSLQLEYTKLGLKRKLKKEAADKKPLQRPFYSKPKLQHWKKKSLN